MKLTFQNAEGKERVIADIGADGDVYGKINEFCDDHGFRIPYMRAWVNEDGVTTYDVGSHYEFFKLYPTR